VDGLDPMAIRIDSGQARRAGHPPSHFTGHLQIFPSFTITRKFFAGSSTRVMFAIGSPLN